MRGFGISGPSIEMNNVSSRWSLVNFVRSKVIILFMDEKERSTTAVDTGNDRTLIATVRSAGKSFA